MRRLLVPLAHQHQEHTVLQHPELGDRPLQADGKADGEEQTLRRLLERQHRLQPVMDTEHRRHLRMPGLLRLLQRVDQGIRMTIESRDKEGERNLVRGKRRLRTGCVILANRCIRG